MHKLMLVHDNPRRRQVLQENLTAMDYDVVKFDVAGGLLHRAREEHPDVVVMSTEGDRQHLDRFITWLPAQISVVGLTPHMPDATHESMFRVGPDVSMADPTTPDAFVDLDTTIKAVLETPVNAADDSIRIGSLVIDPRRRTASMGRRQLDLLRLDYQLLLFLAQRQGQTVKREDIARALKPAGGWIEVTATYAHNLRDQLRERPLSVSYLKGNLRDGLSIRATPGS